MAVKPVDDLLRDYDLDGLSYGSRYEGRYEGNWKVAIEGGIEEYHLPWGHPQTMVGVVDAYDEQMMHGSCFASTYYVPKLTADGHHVERFAPLNLPSLRSRTTDGRLSPDCLYVVNLFPTVISALNADHLLYALFNGSKHSRIVVLLSSCRGRARAEAASDPRRLRTGREGSCAPLAGC